MWCCQLWRTAVLSNTKAEAPKGLRLQDSFVNGRRVLIPIYSCGRGYDDMLVTHCPFCGEQFNTQLDPPSAVEEVRLYFDADEKHLATTVACEVQRATRAPVRIEFVNGRVWWVNP